MKKYVEHEKNGDMPQNKDAKDIMTAASNILVFADNTEKSLREKLEKRGFEVEAINEAVEKLKQAGLLNDARLFGTYTEYLAEKKLYGKARIRLELRKKGFDSELIGEQLDDCVADVDFKENCLKLMKKKRLTDKIRDSRSARAVTAALARYGYGYAEIKYAYTRLLKEDEEE